MFFELYRCFQIIKQSVLARPSERHRSKGPKARACFLTEKQSKGKVMDGGNFASSWRWIEKAIIDASHKAKCIYIHHFCWKQNKCMIATHD